MILPTSDGQQDARPNQMVRDGGNTKSICPGVMDNITYHPNIHISDSQF